MGNGRECVDKVWAYPQHFPPVTFLTPSHFTGLPLQLLPAFQSLLAAKCHHRAQLCKMMALAPHTPEASLRGLQDTTSVASVQTTTQTTDNGAASNGTLVALARGAEDTARLAVQRARALLFDQKFLLPTQVTVMEKCYKALVGEAHRMRIQGLIQDARHAVFTGKARFVNTLLDWCLESVDVSFGEGDEESKGKDDRRGGVLRTVQEVRDLAAKTSTATNGCTADEVCVCVCVCVCV